MHKGVVSPTKTGSIVLKCPKFVYKASCWDCHDFYIGKTKRRLRDRKTEHSRQSPVTVIHQEHPTTVFCKISVRRSKNSLKFSIAWERLKIARWPFPFMSHSCTIFEAYLINSLRFVSVKRCWLCQNSNITSRHSGHFFMFGFVFFVRKCLLGKARQWNSQKFAILSLKPRSHFRSLIYRALAGYSRYRAFLQASSTHPDRANWPVDEASMYTFFIQSYPRK